MAKQQEKGLAVPLNFLLTCSDSTLDTYELARLAEVGNLRAEMHEIFDRLLDASSQASLVRWFRAQDRQALKHAIENEETPVKWAKRKIRDGQRSEVEQELIPLPGFKPEAAHLAAALRYQERNIAEGKCQNCPKPLDRNSVDMCTDHLAKARARKGPKGQPGSTDYLYGDGFQDRHGRQPGTLASLEMSREKKTRAVLAELGIPPESAAVSLKAATEALQNVIPHGKAKALSQADLFEKAGIPTKTTGQRALRGLLDAGAIQRIGKGISGNPFRYFQ